MSAHSRQLIHFLSVPCTTIHQWKALGLRIPTVYGTGSADIIWSPFRQISPPVNRLGNGGRNYAWAGNMHIHLYYCIRAFRIIPKSPQSLSTLHQTPPGSTWGMRIIPEIKPQVGSGGVILGTPRGPVLNSVAYWWCS